MREFIINKIEKIKSGIKRYKISLLLSYITALSFIVERQIEEGLLLSQNSVFLKVNLTLIICFFVTLIIESSNYLKNVSIFKQNIIKLIFVGICFFMSFNLINMEDPFFMVSYFLCIFALFLIFILQFKVKTYIDYMKYLKIIFIKGVESLFFSIFIFLGFLIILGSIHLLFDIDIPDSILINFTILDIGIFLTSFFLSNIPKDIREMEDIKESILLKGFLKFICVPTLSILTMIFYIYLIKILILRKIPNNMVAVLVLNYSFTIFAVNILLKTTSEFKFKVFFDKIISKLSFFPIILGFLALIIRINQYGLTEARVYGIYGLIFLLIYNVNNIIFGYSKIKKILILFVCMLFVSTLGPISSHNLALSSQIERLKNICNETGIIYKPKIQAKKVDDLKKEKQIREILYYLERNQGNRGLVYFKDVSNYKDIYNKFEIETGKYLSDRKMFYINVKEENLIKINKPSYIISLNSEINKTYDELSDYDFKLNYKEKSVNILYNKEEYIKINLNGIINELVKKSNGLNYTENSIFKYEDKNFKGEIIINRIEGYIDKEAIVVNSMDIKIVIEKEFLKK